MGGTGSGSSSSSPSLAIHALYALSGATALVYQVVWTRLLALELGHTVTAASTVLAAFMGGLAAGALVGGRAAPRLSPLRALRAYAAIEVSIGVFALLVPTLLTLAHPLLSVAYAEGTGGLLFQTSRLAAALLIAGLPAFVMGATYPLIVRATGVVPGAAGSLYASNTIGAAVGAIAAGFLLLRVFGATGTTMIGAFGNALVAVVAWRIRPHSDERGDVPKAESRLPSAAGEDWIAPMGGLTAAAAAGFAALLLEVAWTRTLSMIMGPTTYAFSAMVGCFILGLAIGSTVGTGLARRSSRRVAWLALIFSIASLATALAVSLVDDALLAVARRAADPRAELGALIVYDLQWALLLVGPAAACFGALFPLTLESSRAMTPRAAAQVYGANTAGAIAGALAAGLLCIPMLGVHATFALAVFLTAAAALASAASTARRTPVLAGLVLCLCAASVASLATLRWNPKLLSSGGYKYSSYVSAEHLRDTLRDLLEAGVLRYYREGATGTVAVRDLAGTRSLSIDGKVDASNGGDMLTQRLLAHLPLLAHGAARRVAVIGLGSGVTLGSALTYPIRSAEVIEISPEVVDASTWFKAENRDALRDPRVRLVRGDARTHFRLGAGAQYDVIISEPSNPWMAGVAALFTREFFEAVRARLARGGVVCQWTHTYDISREDLRSIVATFTHVFPATTLWLVGDGDLLLIGRAEPGPAADLRAVMAAAPEPAVADLGLAGIRTHDQLAMLSLGNSALARRWSAGAPLQTDDRMSLEFSAPAATIGPTRHDNAADLLGAAEGGAIERDHAAAGMFLLRAQAPRRAWTHLPAAVEARPEDRDTVAAFVEAAAAVGHLRDAETTVERLIIQYPRGLALRLEYAKLLAARGDLSRAHEHIASAAAIFPQDHALIETMAAISADAEDVETLRTAVARLRRLQPHASSTLYYDAVLALLSGRAEAARDLARRAVAADASYAAAWNLLGVSLGAIEAPADDVRAAFQRAIAADPSDAASYVNLGMLDLRTGRPAAAIDNFAQALTLDPANASARDGLALARRSLL